MYKAQLLGSVSKPGLLLKKYGKLPPTYKSNSNNFNINYFFA